MLILAVNPPLAAAISSSLAVIYNTSYFNGSLFLGRELSKNVADSAMHDIRYFTDIEPPLRATCEQMLERDLELFELGGDHRSKILVALLLHLGVVHSK